MRAILAATFISLLAAAALAAQQPTFRSRVDTVNVHVTVRDANGRLVPDLSKDDFELYDAGKRREIGLFSGDIQPIAISLLLDRSGSTSGHSSRILDAAEAFMGELRDDDRGAVHTLEYECQSLTVEKSQLYRTLRSLIPMDLQSPVWSSLDRTMSSMADVPGRRAILLFSDGDDSGPGVPLPSSSFPALETSTCRRWTTHSTANFDDALRRAQRDGVMIYTVSVENSIGRSKDDDLRAIAQKSGGERYRLKDPAELTAAFKRIAEELHHQYLLGFVPAVYDGKVHEIEVRVKRPGLTVRARKSYVADRSDPAAIR